MSIFKKKPVVITLEDVCAIIRDEIRFHKHDRLQFEVYALEAKVKELTEQIESNIAQIHVQQQWLEIRGDKVKELETQLAEAREEIEPQEKALTHYISEFGLTKEAYEILGPWVPPQQPKSEGKTFKLDPKVVEQQQCRICGKEATLWSVSKPGMCGQCWKSYKVSGEYPQQPNEGEKK